MRRHYSLPLLLLFFASLQAIAQSNGAVTYTAADGLATGNFLSFLQDRQGYLWVGSYSSGASRFDGKRWEKWGVRQGLLQNAVTDLYEDAEGGLLFLHGDLGASRLYRDSFEKRPMATVPDMFFDFLARKELRYDRNNGRLLAYEKSTHNFRTNGEQLLPNDWLSRYERVNIHWQTGPNRYLIMAWRSGKTAADLFLTTPAPDPKPTLLQTLPKAYIGTSIIINAAGSLLLTDFAQRHFFLLQNGVIQPFPLPSIPGYAGVNPSLEGVSWKVDPYSKTLLLVWQLQEKTGGKTRYLLADYDLKDFRLRQTLLFSTSFKVVHCFKDRANTYWISTDANVLRLFPEQFFISTEAPGMIPSAWSAAEARDGDIWFSSYGFGLARFDGLNMQAGPAAIDRKAHFDNGSLVDGQGTIYFNAENLQTTGTPTPGLLKFDGTPYDLLTPGTIGFFLAYDRQGRLMRGTHKHGLWILPKGRTGRDSTDWIRIDRSKGLLLENVLTVANDSYGHYWMGRMSQGLAFYDPVRDTVFNWIKSQEKPYYGVMSMDLDTHENLWLGTDRGLCFMKTPARVDGSFDPLAHMRLIGLDYTGESAVTSVKMYDAHTLLFGNAQGLYCLDLDAFYNVSEQVAIRLHSAKNGNSLGAVEQNAMFITRQKQVWVMGAQGALRFDPRLAGRDTVTPSVQLDSLRTDRELFTEFTHPLGLGSGSQRVRLYFHHGLNPLLLDNIQFRHRLTGDSTWSALSETSWVEYPRLAPGRYTFEVVAEKYGLQSAVSRVEFRIAPVWWQNPWFWLAALASVIGIAVFLRNKERKIAGQAIQLEKTKTEMALMSKEKDKLQVQAIVNQLNPHFINNALQWLQVRVDEDEEAVRVVGKLSENIATVFKNSRQKKPFHALHDELKLAENYLFIQKCRFRERLHYDLPAEADLEDMGAVDVPLMIVQIHVENAVEHGIRSKTDGSGRVQIGLSAEVDYVVITVTDDGVGRAAAQQIGSRGTQNGTLMLKELATIYNRQNRLPIEQRYEDGIFTTPEGKSYGTRVVIRIPRIYHYDL